MRADLLTAVWLLLGTTGAAVVLLLRWLLARAGTAVDEMIKQDYASFAFRVGDMVIWLASRRTPDPEHHFEEWLAHMRDMRAATGHASLPEALWILAAAGRVKALPPPQPLGAVPPDRDFGDNVLDQIFTLWVEPELARRGRPLDRASVGSAVVLMAPGAPPHVLLDDEAPWVARVRAKRAIEAGEAVTSDDIDVNSLESLTPANLDPNTAWTGFVTFGPDRLIAFDFRRNRKTAADLLAQARKEHALGISLIRRWERCAGADHLHAAADAAVVAQQLLHADEPIADPAERVREFRSFAQLGNVPAGHARCLDRLVELKSHRSMRTWLHRTPSKREFVNLAETVEDMINIAKMRVGEVTPPDRPERSESGA